MQNDLVVHSSYAINGIYKKTKDIQDNIFYVVWKYQHPYYSYYNPIAVSGCFHLTRQKGILAYLRF